LLFSLEAVGRRLFRSVANLLHEAVKHRLRWFFVAEVLAHIFGDALLQGNSSGR
jgi:hypothetical protein